jgi:hypothetical protein
LLTFSQFQGRIDIPKQGETMLGYTNQDLADMVYGVYQADFLINADENPAIHNYLVMTHDFLMGLLAEGHFNA